jgi:hypothetical protein
MSKLRLLTFFYLLIFGCKPKINNNITFIYPTPESVTKLTGEIVDIDIIGFGKLHVIDSSLILLNTKSEHIFEIYHTKTLEKLAAFGTIGEGPDEFLHVDPTEQEIVVKSDNRKYLELYDLEKKRLSYLDPIAAINDPDYTVTHESLPKINLFVRQVIHKNDSILYFIPENQGRFMMYDYKSKEVKSIPFLPELDLPIQEKNKWMVYSSVFAVNQKLNRIAAAPMLLGQLDYFNFGGEHLYSTNFDDFNNYREQLTQDNVTNTTLKRYILSLKQFGDYIFAWNYDWSFENSRNKKSPEKSRIMQFEWDGNLVREYVLDKNIGSFAYDEINKCFFVFCPDDEDHPVWRYQLPGTP